jgi:exodeoxyribonuclease VII large subunit
MLEPAPRIWQVGALCRAVSDALDARFNPVSVRGEISGFSRASSGHCYFSIKDPGAQIRCVMFKRAAALAGFSPRDGELVDLRGRLGLYDPRGDLQLIVESMSPAGPGALYEQFVRLKLKLEAEGLFEAQRKRPLPLMPRGIGVVPSLGAAALHDVISVLQRRVPHIPVIVAVASVQGANAAVELSAALKSLYQLASPALDAILLVRGGGAMEDLWSFNDESLARVIALSPIPVISGVGHETDFTIADFVADVRAPTPTAAAELVAQSRDVWVRAIEAIQLRLDNALSRLLDTELQRLDTAAARLGRPSALAAAQHVTLVSLARRLRISATTLLLQEKRSLHLLRESMPVHARLGLERSRARLVRAELRLGLLDPSLVLRRGYAWLSSADGQAITSVWQVQPGQLIQAQVADGTMELQVRAEI